ncbi:MAG TPA: glucosamine-6-phosphate synthase, partial [Ilumatobacteraceae bacterium]|nr:glucosamine-6-phosphate synthase [Ilumatobacteraceae bacterium]
MSRPPTVPVPTAAEIVSGLDVALAARPDVASVAVAVAATDVRLRGLPGLLALADHHELVSRVESRLDELEAFADEIDDQIESGILGADDIESASASLVALRDASWAIRHDRLRTAREVAKLAGREASVGAMAGYLAVQRALSAIDRLEVRGRDSAGLHLFVW